MTIYYVLRAKIKDRLVGQTIDKTIYFFHPSLDVAITRASILASRYKRKYAIRSRFYPTLPNPEVDKFVTFVKCAGVGKPIQIGTDV